MAKEIENNDSPNVDQFDVTEIDSITDIETLRTKVKEYVPKVQDSNRQLFARAKKAEGFELKDGKWIKPEKAPTAPANPNSTPTSPSSDFGEKAYLIANGIKGSDEFEFVEKMKKETGLSLDKLLETTYFQTEFKDFKEKKTTAAATPSGSKRTTAPSIDTVEYWIAKGELPPENQPKLRQAVVNARIKKEESRGPFYNS